jgi:hypothetical protein
VVIAQYNVINIAEHIRKTSTVDAYNLQSYGEKYRLYHFVILGKNVFLTVIKFVKHDHVFLVSLQDLFSIMIDFILFYFFYN